MKVALLTAGGLAPCLSTAVADLIKLYQGQTNTDVEIIAYIGGYMGLLQGNSISIPKDAYKNIDTLIKFGGSPIKNSRVKLTNADDIHERGLIPYDVSPVEGAAEQLKKDKVDVLHTIGGDDTNTTAADLAKFLEEKNYDLRVIGLPKTVDNDIYPIKQSLGADTAADNGVIFSKNVIAEHSANPNTLIVHEVMGRHCGWLTVETAIKYRRWLNSIDFVPELGVTKERLDIHGVYIPEIAFNMEEEIERLKNVMEKVGNVNVFLSEGAITEEELARGGGELPRDAFGHVRLDDVNPGKWFADRISKEIGAKKVLVQKSGYFSRSGPSNEYDRDLIMDCAKKAVDVALFNKESGVVGVDDNTDGKSERPGYNEVVLIDFKRIKGGKSFSSVSENYNEFKELLKDIGQEK